MPPSCVTENDFFIYKDIIAAHRNCIYAQRFLDNRLHKTNIFAFDGYDH